MLAWIAAIVRGVIFVGWPIALFLLGYGTLILFSRWRRPWETTAFAIVLLVVGFLWLSSFVYVWDKLPAARDQGRLAACRSNLRQIGLLLTMYQGNHDGAMPGSLEALKDDEYISAEYFDGLVTCPSANPRDYYTPPLPPERYRYVYRPVERATSGDMVCWDAEPHIVRHRIFKFLNRMFRNVLYDDGDVETIPESGFQRLKLPSGD